MKDYPYFKAYVAEILFDTMGMTQAQKGDYLDSLLLAWKTMNPEKMPQWMQEYSDETIRKSAKLSENSKVRWTNAMQLHSKSSAKAMQTPYIEERRGEERIGKDRKVSDLSLEFIAFWNAYPKKVSKPQAMLAFKKAIEKVSLGKMIHSVNLFSNSQMWKDNDGKYIPNPATWLNGERWNDEPVKIKSELQTIDWDDAARNFTTVYK